MVIWGGWNSYRVRGFLIRSPRVARGAQPLGFGYGTPLAFSDGAAEGVLEGLDDLVVINRFRCGEGVADGGVTQSVFKELVWCSGCVSCAQEEVNPGFGDLVAAVVFVSKRHNRELVCYAPGIELEHVPHWIWRRSFN
jgi:hypothetical protein